MMHLVRRLWPSRSSLSSCRHLSSGRVPPPCLDLSYLSNPANRDQILDNVAQRERPIQELDKILDRLQQGAKEPDPELVRDLCQIPNRSHPDVASYGREPRLIKARPWTSRILPKAEAEEKEPKLVNFISLAKAHQGLRTQDLNHLCGERTYYFSKALADLEQALVMYSVDRLTQEFGFELVSVPDLLHPDILEACGMDLHKGRTQVGRTPFLFYFFISLQKSNKMSLATTI